MCKNGIPANADNKVVAGENTKVMTTEILEGIVREAVAGYIDNLVDATWEGFDEYSRIEEDEDGNSGEYEYLEFSNIFREDMENSELWSFHDGAFMKWCEEHDKIPNPDNIEELLRGFNDDTGLYIFYLPEYIIDELDHPVLPEYNGCVEAYWEEQKSTE